MCQLVVFGISLPSNHRVTGEIERTLRRGANMPRTKHNKGRIEGQKLKIQEIRSTLDAPSALLPVDSHGGATTSTSESGASSVPLSPILYGALVAPISQL